MNSFLLSFELVSIDSSNNLPLIVDDSQFSVLLLTLRLAVVPPRPTRDGEVLALVPLDGAVGTGSVFTIGDVLAVLVFFLIVEVAGTLVGAVGAVVVVIARFTSSLPLKIELINCVRSLCFIPARTLIISNSASASCEEDTLFFCMYAFMSPE